MVNFYKTVDSFIKFLFFFIYTGLFFFSTISLAQSSPITKVVAQGDSMPGGGNFRQIGAFSLNDNDEVVFTSTAGAFTSEIFLSSGGTITKKVSQNDSLPGIGKFGSTNGSAVTTLNNQGTIVFFVVVPNVSPAQYELFKLTDQGISKVARDGDVAPSGPISAPTLRPYSLNNQGQVAYEAFYSDPFRQVILINSEGTTSEAVVTGNPTPVGGTFRFAFMHINDFNDAGAVLFDSQIDTTSNPGGSGTPAIPRAGIFVSTGGVITKVAAQGEAAPDGKKYTGFGPLASINNLGDIFFQAEACEDFDSCYDGLFLYSGGSISLVVKEGDPAPGGGIISNPSNPLINDNKDMIFQASVDNAGSFTQGIFRVSNGAIEKIISSGDPAPEGGSIVSFSLAMLNASGTLAFMAFQNRGDTTTSGIYLWNSGPRLGLSKNRIEFTDFTPGQTARSELEISNSGGKTLEVQEITAAPNPPFGLDELPALPFSLEAGQKARFVVTYQSPDADDARLLKTARPFQDGSLTIRTNAPGGPAVVPIIPPNAYSLLPDGAAIDPANPYLEGGGALHSKFTDLTITGTGLELVNQVTFDPPDNIEVTRVNAAAAQVDFDVIVYHDALLGERDIILKTSDGREINVSQAAARKFIITKINTQFNQAVDQAAVSTLQYRDKLVSNKPGVLRVQFQDPAQYGQIFNSRLEVQGVGTLLSPIVHAPQESYSEADIINGRDYLTMPIPQPLSAGKRTFKFVMTRLNDGRIIYGPVINREVITSVAFNVVSIGFRVTRPDGTVLSPISDQEAGRALDLLRLVYPVSGDMLDYRYVGLRNLPSSLAEKMQASQLQNGTAITIFTQEAKQIIGPVLGRLLMDLNSKRQAKGLPEVNMLIGFFPAFVFYADKNNDGIAEESVAGATSTILNISYQAPESGDVQQIMAHEIGHAFQGSLSLLNVLNERFGFGDEYEGGSFNCEKNPPVKEAMDFLGSASCANSPFTEGVNGDKIGTYTDPSAFNPVALRPMLTFMGTAQNVINYNFMSAATGTNRTWVQPTVYDELLKSFLPVAGTQPNSIAGKNLAQTNAIRLRGTIFSNDRVSFDDFDLISVGERSPDAGGPYSFELQSSEGSVLASKSFNVNFIELSNPPRMNDYSLFNIVMDLPEGTKKIVLKKNGIELASKALSDNAPVIQIAAALDAGEGRLRIVWGAEDPDGDSLHYTILYSPDDQNWLPVESNLSSTNNYILETAQYPGGSSAKVAIIASDGVHSSDYELSLSSGVEKKKPVVKFISPGGDTTYNADNPLVLAAGGYDPEDGILPDSNLIFSSSIDGQLGKGSPFYVRSLSQGLHTIYVSASDKDGNIAMDSLQLSVLAPVGVDENKNNIPLSYSLKQNYPNPFNPSTNINFELPQSSPVTIKIYNIQGQEVSTLTDEVYSAGSYVLQWNGKDSRGMGLPTGIYFIQMHAGDFMVVKKALLLK